MPSLPPCPCPCFLPAPLSPFSSPRRRRGRSPCRRARPLFRSCAPPPPSALSAALHEIRTFTSAPSSPAARALTIRLINDVSSRSTPGVISPSGTSFGTLFTTLQSASLLRAFSSHRAPAPSSARNSVSADRLAAQAGLPISALSPRPSTVLAWQAAGVAAVLAVVQLARLLGVSDLARPALLAAGAALLADQLALRGAVFEAVYRTLFPAYAEKVLKHEAGHFLAAYLHGLAVRGYVLSAREALNAGIPGQAGTLFEDEQLFAELRKGILSNRAIDRFSIVSMAGIAAEAIHYGEAEGGESDVAALIQMLTTLSPPWKESAVREQARWAVLEAVLLLRKNRQAYDALCEAMRERKSLGECVLVIEDNFVPPEPDFAATANVLKDSAPGGKTEQELLEEREKAILAELEHIKKQVDQLEKE